MRVFNVLNIIIIEISRGGQSHYFLLDSGFPISFSRDIDDIYNNDLGFEDKYCLELSSEEMIPLTQVSEYLGVNICGFLGMDFFNSFQNILLDFKGRSVKFNVQDFTSDFNVDLVPKANPLIKVAAENEKQSGRYLVDTGSFQCIKRKENFERPYKSSKGWKIPSPLGEIWIDYYSDIELLVDGVQKGKYVFGVPSSSDIGFDYVLGLNFLADYICLFDMKKDLIRFKVNDKPTIINTNPEFSLGFQLKIVDKRIIVSNLLQGYNHQVKMGDEIIISGIDMDNPEAANEIYKKLMFLASDEEVEIMLNGEKVSLTPQKLFR